MCGINGFSFCNKQSQINVNMQINVMNEKILHRGPDEQGIYVHDTAAIGMTRLSIIDLSTGRQPISNETGNLQIVFNGEIYNHIYLREELEKKGHCFKTKTDTETILHAYEEYGTECLQKIKGMFAFAIYDQTDNSFFIARDRLGEKPLYYSLGEQYFIFASELKSILATGFIEKRINKKALAQYMALSYIPAPLSILESVYKLSPGHYITIDSGRNLSINRYWNVSYSKQDKITDYTQCKKLLRETVFSSVERCMISDVPIGAFLSGGIDSTIIAGVMSEISPNPISTFTIGFHDKAYDESSRAGIAAEKFGTDHHVKFIGPQDMLESLKPIIDNMDEPFADSSCIPTYLVSGLAHQSVKTVLTGDSGDELFAGYEKYLIGYYSNIYNKLPRFLREKTIKKFIYALPDKGALTRKARKVIDNAELDVFSQRRNLMCLAVKYNELQSLLRFDCSEALDFIQDYYAVYADEAEEIDCALYTDLKVVLEGDMLCKVDRMSMLTSLETRVPLLYPDVVELAAKIPAKYKINGRNKKIILKDTFSDIIPQELLQASKKGFAVPMNAWLKNELKEDLLKVLDKEKICEQGLFNYEYIEQLLEEHFNNKRDNSGALWALYVFEQWYEKYFLL